MNKIRFWLSLCMLTVLFSCHIYSKEKYTYDLSICAIFQNEAPYLKEWIEFHRLTGVQHFYLYNNLSTDNYSKVLKPYIKSGVVELIDWDYKTNSDGGNWSTIQVMAYNDAIVRAKNHSKWLALIDTDEFIFPVEQENLVEFLKNYEDAAALCVNWQMYGTSGIKEIPKNHLLIEDLVYKAPTEYDENRHIKSIVRPEFVETTVTPHCCSYLPGCVPKNSDKEPCYGNDSPIKIDKIRINHYWTRDEKYFNKVKLPRRQIWQDGGCIERAKTLNSEIDLAIHKYVPKLKKKMKILSKDAEGNN